MAAVVKGREIGAQVKTGGSSRSPAKYIQNIQNIEGIWCGYKKKLTSNIKLKTGGGSRPRAQYIQN